MMWRGFVDLEIFFVTLLYTGNNFSLSSAAKFPSYLPSQMSHRLLTRTSNKDIHPGLIIKPATRRLSEAVAKEKAEKAAKQAQVQAAKKAGVAKAAALQNSMEVQDYLSRLRPQSHQIC